MQKNMQISHMNIFCNAIAVWAAPETSQRHFEISSSTPLPEPGMGPEGPTQHDGGKGAARQRGLPICQSLLGPSFTFRVSVLQARTVVFEAAVRDGGTDRMTTQKSKSI